MEEKIYTVSEFNQNIDSLLREVYAYPVKIQGEVADFRIAQDKWVHFFIKDDQARLACFLALNRLDVDLKDGQEIRVWGKPSIFVPYGKFTFQVWEIELVGEGALKKALERLKLKLEKEGLFDLERKRPLPLFPRKIGLITSRKAAAFNDFIKIVNSRWSGVKIYVADVQVQGKEAVPQIVNALNYFNSQKDKVDVLVLTRGGGSLEDLQAFNSERVVRAIFASKIPVLSGIGHERDWTLADLVADKRASTPSNAAEIVVPSQKEIIYQIETLRRRIILSYQDYHQQFVRKVQEKVKILDKVLDRHLESYSAFIKRLYRSLSFISSEINLIQNNLQSRVSFLMKSFSYWYQSLSQLIKEKEKIIKKLSPEATLKRGYSIVFRKKDGRIITKAQQVKKEEELNIKLYQGSLFSKVTKVIK
jgi:exodeoxyribonuclease VII large subunit